MTEDISGLKFNRLTAVGYLEHRNKKPYWLFVCDCGQEKIASKDNVKRGQVQSCGCLRKENPITQPHDWTGKKYGRLTALYYVEHRNNRPFWNFQCSCGTEKILGIYNVSAGGVKSCGCLNDEIRRTVHQDLTGNKYGSATVIRRSSANGSHAKWECLCDCGKSFFSLGINLTRGQVISCGCSRLWTGNKHRSWRGYGEISRAVWNSYKGGAEQRNFEFSVSIEQGWNLFIAQDRKCALSGIPIAFASRDDLRMQEMTASLDRRDSSLGYVEGNIQWVHKVLNRMKWNLNQDEFVKWCRFVVQYDQSVKGEK